MLIKVFVSCNYSNSSFTLLHFTNIRFKALLRSTGSFVYNYSYWVICFCGLSEAYLYEFLLKPALLSAISSMVFVATYFKTSVLLNAGLLKFKWVFLLMVILVWWDLDVSPSGVILPLTVESFYSFS